MKSLRIIFALTIISIATCFAQSNDDKKVAPLNNSKKSSNVVEVKLNVMAHNVLGQAINDVKAEDIKVFEDGVEQKITYFAQKQPVFNVGLVMDNSGSMKTSLNEIIKAGSIITSNLRSTDEAFLVRFISSDKIEITQEWTSDQAAMIEALNNLFIEGGPSAIIDAVYLSAEKVLERAKKDNSKRYAIVLISDTEDRDSFYKLKEALELFKGTDVQVFTLSYAPQAPTTPKKAIKLSYQLAMATGGTAFVLNKKHSEEEFLNAIKGIVYELRSQYIVGYTSTNQSSDNKPRKISVQIADSTSGDKRLVYARESFIVPEN